MSTTAYQYVTFEGYAPLSDNGPYTVNDFMQLPEGEPVELIRGRLTLSPAPNTFHQFVLAQLWRVMQQAEEQGGGVAYFAPIDVVLDKQNVLQPDIVYLAKDRLGLVAERIQGAPSLVVEVISPSTANRDRQEKLDIYARFAVPEYWIVDPDSRTIQFLVHESGRYVVVTPVEGAYRSSVTPELEIRPADFWREVDRRLPRREG